MITNYPQALKEIYNQLTVAWNANSASIVGYVPEIRYGDEDYPNPPDGDKHYVHVSFAITREEQRSLSTSVFAPGLRGYSAYGLFFVQLFAPKNSNGAMEKARLLAVLAQNAYAGKCTEHNVWFRNTKIVSLNSDTKFRRLNVTGEFEYDRIG